MTKLILIRGIPGTGKSTLARFMQGLIPGSMHFEADMFFMVNGEYRYDRDKISDAHEWCMTRTEQSLKMEHTVIVSNTFVNVKTLKPYFAIAKKFGIVPTVIIANGSFQNEHNVPVDVLARMKSQFQLDTSELFS